jgi:gamma-glutamyltranspeptidase
MVRLLLITLFVRACLPGAETWRPTITPVDWAVASGNPETAMAAARILVRGGNAIDAMVMIYRAGTGKVSCVDGSGWSGRRSSWEVFARRKGGLPSEDALAPTVPGLVEATHQLPAVGSVRAVVIDPRNGMLLAGAAPGSDAYALGW